MKTPPLLLGATLLFWGWQTEYLLLGALLGVLIESGWAFKTRWDFSDDDFARVRMFSSLLLLGAALYAFAESDGISTFGGMFGELSANSQRKAAVAGGQTARLVMRWLPVIFFPLLAAQIFSTREGIPMASLSSILAWRVKRAKESGRTPPASRSVDFGQPFFCAALFSASVHPSENLSYFWGVCVLVTWALWSHRSRRFALPLWIGAVLLALTLGYFGQRGVGSLVRYATTLQPQWIARLLRRQNDANQSRTSLGEIGAIKTSSRIVVRLEPRDGSPAPEYLREASYRQYRDQMWFAGKSRTETAQIRQDPPDSGTWILQPTKTNKNVVEIACYLEGTLNGAPAGLLPLPAGSSRLEKLPAYDMEQNSAGAVMAQGPGLLIFDAFHGPGATIDWPPDTESQTNNNDLAVSQAEEYAISKIAMELNLGDKTDEEKLKAVAGYFSDNFTYTLWQAPQRSLRRQGTPLSRFLLNTHKGHCEYFATATVLLLRKLGIPARYATGYAVHETSGDGYVVRQSDAHAWTLVWDRKAQLWKDFDTTPPSWVKEESKGRSPFRWIADLWSRMKFEFSKFRWGQGKIRKYLIWVVIPGMVLLLYQIVFRSRRKKQAPKKTDEGFFASWPGLDSDFYLLEKKLASLGITRATGEPLNDWLKRATKSPALAELRPPIQEVLRLHYQYRFDPLGLNSADREALKRETARCLGILANIG